MTKMRRWVVVLTVLLLVFSMAACGGSGEVKQQTDTEAEENAAAETIPEPDAAATADGLLGSWTDINAGDRFANITKTDTGYQYEDNEGAYTAEFEDGVMIVTISERDFANVYVEPKTGRMLLVYQGNTTEFQKK
jgi:predicted small lipoprotein YifL